MSADLKHALEQALREYEAAAPDARIEIATMSPLDGGRSGDAVMRVIYRCNRDRRSAVVKLAKTPLDPDRVGLETAYFSQYAEFLANRPVGLNVAWRGRLCAGNVAVYGDVVNAEILDDYLARSNWTSVCEVLEKLFGGYLEPFYDHMKGASLRQLPSKEVFLADSVPRFSIFGKWAAAQALLNQHGLLDKGLDRTVREISAHLERAKAIVNRGTTWVGFAHGDLNLRNVLISSVPLVIDWANADTSLPICADFVRMERSVRLAAMESTKRSLSSTSFSTFETTAADRKDKFENTVAELRRHYLNTCATLGIAGIGGAAAACGSDHRGAYLLCLAIDLMKLLCREDWYDSADPDLEMRTGLVLKDCLGAVVAFRRLWMRPWGFAVVSCTPREQEREERLLVPTGSYGASPFECSVEHAADPSSAIGQNVREMIESIVQEGCQFASFRQDEYIRLAPKSARPIFENAQGDAVDPRLLLIKLRNLAPTCNLDINCHIGMPQGWRFAPKYKLLGLGSEAAQLPDHLVELLTTDKAYRDNLGDHILECVDVLVTTASGNELLLLRRKPVGEQKEGGWEYPKGGMQVHEHPLEAAYRELYEEAFPGTDPAICSYEYVGYLGVQRPHVKHVRPPYDYLLVHGFHFRLHGPLSALEIGRNPEEKHDDKMLVGLSTARELMRKFVPYADYFIRQLDAEASAPLRYEHGNVEAVKNLYRNRAFLESVAR